MAYNDQIIALQEKIHTFTKKWLKGYNGSDDYSFMVADLPWKPDFGHSRQYLEDYGLWGVPVVFTDQKYPENTQEFLAYGFKGVDGHPDIFIMNSYYSLEKERTFTNCHRQIYFEKYENWYHLGKYLGNEEEANALYDEVFELRELLKEKTGDLSSIAKGKGLTDFSFGCPPIRENYSNLRSFNKDLKDFIENSCFPFITSDDIIFEHTKEVLAYKFSFDKDSPDRLYITSYYSLKEKKAVENCRLRFVYDQYENWHHVGRLLDRIEEYLK